MSPKDTEKRVAQAIVIRMRDRRVLSAWECCDDCIANALASLQEIRRDLTNAQVELVGATDGPLFLLIDAMLAGIRQFLTFEQQLGAMDEFPEAPHDFRRHPRVREMYFDGLKALRGHLARCLGQVAVIGGLPTLSGGLLANYQGTWPLEAYLEPALAEATEERHE